MSEPALLEVEELWTSFDTPDGRVRAVNGVSFSVAEGEIVGIVGETGCGKSVTVRSVLGLIRTPGSVDRGSVVFRGQQLIGARAKRLRQIRGNDLGFVAQNPFSVLNPVLSIERQFRNIIHAHEPRRSKAECYERSRAMLHSVGIAGPDRVLTGYAHELSGGMAQRVVIGLALILDPGLVVADEPTTGLDLTVQRQILDLIRSLVRDHQRSMVLVTHDLGVVSQYCDRVVVMYAGKVMESGPVERVLKDPAHPYTRALLQAIPQRGRDLVHLRGSIPDLVHYPAGCPFHARCPYVFDACYVDEPELSADGSDHLFSCHIREGVTADGAT